ncbi:MAG: flagellar biosynthesis protein FlhB [Bdellovibrionota bacterium]
MADDSGEKTEEATAQRREDFRKRGQVAQTKELGSFLTLIGACASIWLLGAFWMEQVSELIQVIFSDYVHAHTRIEDHKIASLFALKKMAFLLGPVFLIALILAMTSSLVQVGILYNEEALKPDLKKIDPISGLKRIFSMKSVVEGVKAVAKVSVVAFIVYLILKDEINTVPVLVEFTVQQLFAYFGDVTVKLIGAVGMFMGILAAADYGFQRFDLEKQMRMTKQEVKEEHKNREGDPLIKSRIRRTQREMANKRMMSDVPKADVIVTNPTHIAVAIKYEQGWMAPMVIAMGADKVAEKIKAIAKENKIPVVENKPLARTIFKTLKVGSVIPRELFQSVAEVLAYVYKLKKKVRV